MNTRSIRIGDLVEVEIRGLIFPAVVRSKAPRVIGIDPVDGIRYTHRYASSRQIRRRIERPEAAA